MLRDLLGLKEIKKIDIDSKNRIIAHRKILEKRPIIKNIFRELHELFIYLDINYLSGDGKKIELGAGAYPIKETYSDVISTDIVDGDNIDQILDAMNMYLKPNSVRVFFGQNVFHHFPDPKKFFSEIDRVLEVGGGAILLEPYYGLISSLIYPHISATESFDKRQLAWEGEHTGPMKGANQALSYIVFKRDRDKFLNDFPNLEIKYHKTTSNYMRYLLSGGLNFKQLVPNFMERPIQFLEYLLTPFHSFAALHHVIVIKKCK